MYIAPDGHVLVYDSRGGLPIGFTTVKRARRLVARRKAEWVFDRGEAAEGMQVHNQTAIRLESPRIRASHLTGPIAIPPYEAITGGSALGLREILNRLDFPRN